MGMTLKKRAFALLLSVGILCVLLSSVLYAVGSSGHFCVGHDCPVCCQIDFMARALKALSLAAVFLAAVAVVCLLLKARDLFFCSEHPVYTPIALKIRLLN